MEGSLIVFGNLLLDMVLEVEDSFLTSYELAPDSTQTVSTPKHFELLDEVRKAPGDKLCMSPGGSALNTVRMAQRILNIPNAIRLVGAVGQDSIGRRLIDTVAQEGINLIAQTVPNQATGRCAILLTKGGCARTMVTHLGAATHFSHANFAKDWDWREWVRQVKCVYISGYFLKVSSATVMDVVRFAASVTGVTVVLNLNAVWVTTTCRAELVEVLPFVDVLIGNETEASAFAHGLELITKSLVDNGDATEFMKEIAASLASVGGAKGSEQMHGKKRVVIVTRGEEPIICAEGERVREYIVPKMPSGNLVDTTGAGDAFVGGFLASFVSRGSSLDDCISCGMWAASEELKGYGFVLPPSDKIPSQFLPIINE